MQRTWFQIMLDCHTFHCKASKEGVVQVKNKYKDAVEVRGIYIRVAPDVSCVIKVPANTKEPGEIQDLDAPA